MWTVIPIRGTWLVATIFALQSVLLGAAPPCDCAPPAPVTEAESCCAEEEHECCSVAQQSDEQNEPVTVAPTTTIQFIATPTGTAHPPAVHAESTLLKLTAQAHPTGLWSEFIRAERAPPLS
jgi:hypothetical protein